MALHQATICVGCWQRLRIPVPLRGIWAAPFRIFGIRPSKMHPNTCTLCEIMFERVMRARHVTLDATVLFADLRGYTNASRDLSADTIMQLLDTFYDECAGAIWEQDGMINKTIGDAVMAIFNFPIGRTDHAIRAVHAAREIHRRCAGQREAIAAKFGLAKGQLGVGIGIDSGEINFGEFGRSRRDLTAIGNVVNLAARAQSVAAPGETLITGAVRARGGVELENCQAGQYPLKGFENSVELFRA